MKAKYICTISQARKIILGTWASSFLLAVPILFAQVHLEVGHRVVAYWCVRVWDSPPLWRFHELYMLLLILVVPTCVMAVAYTSICWEIWQVMQQRCDMTSGQGFTIETGNGRSVESFPLRYSKRSQRASARVKNHSSFRESVKKVNAVKADEDSNTVKQVIKMLVLVVVLFVICWGPMLIDNLLTAYDVLPKLRTEPPLKHMATAFHLMAYFNSCINPIVYGFMSKNFRESFYKALCLCCYKGRQLNRNASVSQTRTTSVRYER
uniref:G-protein coupled receptors family 1 profile domain-containing protein n=3 Tax=Timema TaxID=61471 RepID=A0A7R9EG53_9NEOP|nr:unnamed protein product [Timema monikensis]